MNNDRYSAVGMRNGKIFLIPLIPNQPMKHITGHKKGITSIDSMFEKNILISGSEDGIVQVWRDGNYKTLLPNDGAINSVSVSQTEPIAIFSGEDRSPSIWNIETGQAVHSLHQHTSPVVTSKMSYDGTKAITGCNDGNVFVYDVRTGKPIRNYNYPDPLVSLSIYNENGYVASGTSDGHILLYDIGVGQIVKEQQIHNCPVVSLSFHPYSKLLASSGQDQKIHLIKAPSLKPLISIEGNQGVVNSLSWSSDGSQFVGVSSDQRLYVNEVDISLSEDDESTDDVFVEENPEIEIQKAEIRHEESEYESESIVNEESKDAEILFQIKQKLSGLSKALNGMSTRAKVIDQKIGLILEAQEGQKSMIIMNRNK